MPHSCPLPCHPWLCVLAAAMLAALAGCQAIDFAPPDQKTVVPPDPEPPRELAMVSLPTYRLAPPDVIVIDVIRLVPRSPYRIEPYDVLQIHVTGTLRREPINNYYLVEADGTVNFGPTYGVAQVVGLTIEEATAQVTRSLQAILQNPQVSMQLARSAGAQRVSGYYELAPDGTINLPHCGSVSLLGKTVAEAREIVQYRLAQYFESPQVILDVMRYNSLSYYIILAGAQAGDNIHRISMTGNETVLDAIAQVNGLSRYSGKTMWIARPAPGNVDREQVLPIDWQSITSGGSTETNYQVLPGDRIYVVDDQLLGLNGQLAKLTSPIERLLGISTLSASTLQSTQIMGRAYNRTRRSR